MTAANPAALHRASALRFETTSARDVGLEALQGRVVAVFYESREQLDESDGLKRELAQMSGLEVLGIADLAAFDYAPARPVVRAFIRALCARHAGLEVWLDWKGALREALDLPRGNHLVLVDRQGRVVLCTPTPADQLSRARVRARASQLLRERDMHEGPRAA